MDYKKSSALKKRSFSGLTLDKKSSADNYTKLYGNTKKSIRNSDSQLDYHSKAKSVKPISTNDDTHDNDNHEIAADPNSLIYVDKEPDPVQSEKETTAPKKPEVNSISLPAIKPRSRRILQNFLLVWLDANIDETRTHFKNSLAELRKIVTTLKIFTDATQCIEYLQSKTREKIFLIVSGSFGQAIVPRVHNIVALDTIFIFCIKKDHHRSWAKAWPKIEGVHDSIESICKHLKKATRACDHNAIVMSFISKDSLSKVASKDRSLNQFPSGYLYSLLFKEILLETQEEDTQPLNDFIQYCREQDIPESELNNFQHEYHNKSAIWWYSSDIFLYSILNKALRSLDMKLMAKLGFFMHNLHFQLEQLHQKQVNNFKREFIVYRGRGFARQSFEQLLNNQGGFISFNNFLSTSKKKEMCMEFVRRKMKKTKDCIGVLFIMTIDPKKVSASTTPFAFIDDESAMEVKQEEILFTMYTIFQVTSIQQTVNDDRLFEVQLSMISDNDPQMVALANNIKGQLHGSTWWHRMGDLMLNVGDFQQAQEVYNQLLEDATSDQDREFIYNQLGEVKLGIGEYKEAASFFENSVKIKLKNVRKDDISLVIVYNQIARVYKNMADYSKALEFYKKSLNITEKAQPPNHPNLAHPLNNIAAVYRDMGNYSKALRFYEKSQKVLERALPPNHPYVAASYNNIGQVYSNMGNYLEALKVFEKSRKILEEVLPPYHPDLAHPYNNIAAVYHDIGNNSKALEFYDKSQKIFQKVLPPNHPHLAVSYCNSGQVYNSMGDYSKALKLFAKSHKIFEKTLPPKHPHLAISYNNIGQAYHKMGNYTKALHFFEKAHKIFEKTLPSNHPHLATSKHDIGLAYENIKNYSKAQQLYQEAVDIAQKSLPSNHPDLQLYRQRLENAKKKI